MRVFLYEFACAQPPDATLPESVRVEGRAMLTALVEDFSRVTGVEVLTLACQSTTEERRAFQDQARRADWSVIIAPEFDGLLLERCRWALEAEGRLLGPSLEIVELAGDKWATFKFFREHHIRTPRTWLKETPARSASKGVASPLLVPRAGESFSFLRKPRHGAGSQGIEQIDATAALEPRTGFILQRIVPGVAASAAFLTGPRQRVPLLPAEQLLSADGRFHYLGGRLPLRTGLAERALRLASLAIRALPQPLGYIGVDLVLGAAADGSADYVIEINPRLTTSYVGLRRMTRENLAELMLQIAAGGSVPPPHWNEPAITFAADGEGVAR